MSRDVAFVMQFRDRECRRVRVAESSGHIHTRDDIRVVRSYIHPTFLCAHICAYIDRLCASEWIGGKNWKGLILRQIGEKLERT